MILDICSETTATLVIRRYSKSNFHILVIGLLIKKMEIGWKLYFQTVMYG